MKGVEVPERIWPVGHPDAPAGAKFLRPAQEEAIIRTMAEPTRAAVWGSEMDTGKTACAAEFIERMDFRRVLIIGVKDTYAQWAGRLAAQSHGAIALRRIDGTKPGKQAFEAMLAGEDGMFFAGSQFLAAQDWEQRDQYRTTSGKRERVWKRHSKVQRDADGVVIALPGDLVLTEPPQVETLIMRTQGEIGPWAQLRQAPAIGPAEFPVGMRRRNHLHRYKKVRPMDLVLFDEIHLVANRKSNGNGTLKSIPVHPDHGWKLGMSGTWVGNRFEHSWAITSWAWPDLIDNSFIRWKDQWCITQIARLKGGKPVLDARGNPVESVTGEKEPGTFVTTLPCYIRLSDPLGPVPAPELFHVDMHPQQAVDYAALEEDGLVWLRAHKHLQPLVTNLPVVKRTRLRTAGLGTMAFDADGEIHFADDTQSSALWALRQITEHPDWAGRQVGIYTHSKRFAEVTVKRMRAAGVDARLWSGDASSKQRDELKRAWLAGEFQYLVSVIAAFSTGLDGFQDVCNRVVWLSEDDNNYLNQQAIKRYFRSGDPEMIEDFRHVKIIVNDTLSAGVFAGNVAKTAAMQATLNIDMPIAA